MSLKDFVIMEKLGQGSFAKVYKVRRLTDQRVYALKQIHIARLDEKSRQNALNEVRFLASFDCRNIVKYYEAFFEDSLSLLCIVMEFANHGDLSQLIESKKHKQTPSLSQVIQKSSSYIYQSQIWKIMLSLIHGIGYLHQRSILHRDIKPENIFIVDGQYKIGDLNVSRIDKNDLIQQQKKLTQVGTPFYASPQIWQNHPYDNKCDIWSLGCVMYHVTTLNVPFPSKSMDKLYKEVTKSTPKPLPKHYSNELSQIIFRCLEKQPSRRPSIDELLSNFTIKMYENLYFDQRQLQYEKSKEKTQLLKTIIFKKGKSFKNIQLPQPNYDQVCNQISNKVDPQKLQPQQFQVQKQNQNKVQENQKSIENLQIKQLVSQQFVISKQKGKNQQKLSSRVMFCSSQLLSLDSCSYRQSQNQSQAQSKVSFQIPSIYAQIIQNKQQKQVNTKDFVDKQLKNRLQSKYNKENDISIQREIMQKEQNEYQQRYYQQFKSQYQSRKSYRQKAKEDKQKQRQKLFILQPSYRITTQQKKILNINHRHNQGLLPPSNRLRSVSDKYIGNRPNLAPFSHSINQPNDFYQHNQKIMNKVKKIAGNEQKQDSVKINIRDYVNHCGDQVARQIKVDLPDRSQFNGNIVEKMRQKQVNKFQILDYEGQHQVQSTQSAQKNSINCSNKLAQRNQTNIRSTAIGSSSSKKSLHRTELSSKKLNYINIQSLNKNQAIMNQANLNRHNNMHTESSMKQLDKFLIVNCQQREIYHKMHQLGVETDQNKKNNINNQKKFQRNAKSRQISMKKQNRSNSKQKTRTQVKNKPNFKRDTILGLIHSQKDNRKQHFCSQNIKNMRGQGIYNAKGKNINGNIQIQCALNLY